MNATSLRRAAFGVNTAAVPALAVLVWVESRSLRATTATAVVGVAFVAGLYARVGKER